MASISESYFTVNAPNVSIGVEASSQFRAYPAKPDGIKAVKLTKSNLKAVAAEVLKNTKLAVQVDETGFNAGPAPSPVDGAIRPDRYEIGDWIAESYDYLEGRVLYRPVSLMERQNYDLR